MDHVTKAVMFLKKKLGFVTGVVQWYARRV
jgi:hypothetical protein